MSAPQVPARPPRVSRPLVSVVTPSFNQGPFLRQAIDSVLGQSYPNVEYLVIDGGSSDETLVTLESYGDRFYWRSQPDRGQSQAINEGFARARGDVLAWLNADDAYCPQAVARAVEVLSSEPQVGLVYGRGLLLDEAGAIVGPFPGSEPFSLWRLLYFLDFILQPTAFFRRADFEAVGGLDEDLHYALDWDLWIRLAGRTEVAYLDETLAQAREHTAAKTARGGWRRIRELRGVTARHTGRGLTPGVRLEALAQLERQTCRVLPPMRPFVRAAVSLLSRRLRANVPDFGDGWLSPRGAFVVPTAWPGFSATLVVERAPARGFRIRFAVGGRSLGRLEIDSPGSFRVAFPLPADGGNSAFRRVEVTSDFSYPAPDNRLRRRSVRRERLQPWQGDPVIGKAPTGC